MNIPGIARVLESAGIPHTLTPGWRDRVWVRGGRPFAWTDIRAVVVHTTESAPSAFQRGEDAPTLQWVINGQGYHTYGLLIGRSGHVYVISAHPGAQAGYGVWPHTGRRGSVIPEDQGNSYSLGVSMDASTQHPPTREQLEALARVLHALQGEWGGELEIIGHGEYNGGTLRTDPTGVPGGMDAVRAAAKRGTWTTPVEPAKTAAPAAVSYQVRPGDSLWRIGQRLGVPAAVIAKENALPDANFIKPGQTLRITPGAPVHVVDKGESFWAIGRRYGLTPERLAALNGKTVRDTIYPGDVLRVA